MSKTPDWIAGPLAEALRAHPSITPPLAERIKQLLEGQLTQRHLTPNDLKTVAAGLIADMVPAPPPTEATQ